MNKQYFDRDDSYSSCWHVVKNEGVGFSNTEICASSHHGLKLTLDVRYGEKQRTVRLTYLYSSDYDEFKDSIIEVTGVRRWIKKKNW